MIDIKDIITLSDNKKYGVVSKTEKNGETYYYLVDIKDNKNSKFCLEDISGDVLKLIEIEDKNIIKELIPLLAKELKDELQN